MTKQEYINQCLTKECEQEYVAEFLLDVEGFIIDTVKIIICRHSNRQKSFYARCNFDFNDKDFMIGEANDIDEALTLLIGIFLDYSNSGSFTEKDIFWWE